MLVASDFKKISKKFNWEEGIFSQEKCDGMRFNAVVDDDRVMYFGRSGKPIEILSKEFSQNFLDLKNSYGKSCVFDGELLVVRDGKILDRKTGNGILNRAVRGTISPEESEQIHATIWDILPYDVFTSDFKKNPSKAYNERFEKLSHLLNDSNSTKVHLVDSKKVFSEEEAMEDFKQKLSEGKEGTILKNPSNVWKDTRVTDCVKLKAELDCDLKVVGIAEGTGKYEGKLGAILCESSDGMLKVSVGTGFTDDDRDRLIKENLVGKIVSVLYNAKICDKKTGVNSLFLPRFIEFREDKSEADSFGDIKG
jgi:DNA ligase-1